MRRVLVLVGALGAFTLMAPLCFWSAAGAGPDDDEPTLPSRGKSNKSGKPGKSARSGRSSESEGSRALGIGKRLRGTDEVTRCAACHAVGGWEKVRFNHDPTGFSLRGAHQNVTCGGCHPRGFDVPVADTCSGCHRDRHAGEFGLLCEGCHDDKSWRPLFQADAHRRTNFPLVGKHGVIPCAQCHGNMRDRTFMAAPVRCVSCHQADFDQTRITSIDHVTAGFSLECQSCHNTLRFWPARMDQHGACFRISSGSHHGIRCLGCHTSLGALTFSGACATGTFTCSSCHAHACAKSATQHTNVMGYECSDPKCYECHKITGQ